MKTMFLVLLVVVISVAGALLGDFIWQEFHKRSPENQRYIEINKRALQIEKWTKKESGNERFIRNQKRVPKLNNSKTGAK